MSAGPNILRLFLCGDVMTGRGIDQALSHPLNPRIYEPYVRDARAYIELAERVNGRIPRPLSFDYIWGEALEELRRAEADLSIINLETAITTAETPWPGKEIHYRMHPLNVGCLSIAGINGCALANNHVLDWGYAGLFETLRTLDSAGIAHAGAGHDMKSASSPAVFDLPGKGRVLLFSFGTDSSGIFREWNATASRPGLNVLDDLSEATIARVAKGMHQFQQRNDLLIASIHWGGNWSHDIPWEQARFAHRLIEEGVAIVHGHSSHHVKAIEVFKDRLILYGCGDFLTDYEGIISHDKFRGHLALTYLIEVDSNNGKLLSARLIPMQMRRFRLERASQADAWWLGQLLNELGAPFGTTVRLGLDGSLTIDGL